MFAYWLVLSKQFIKYRKGQEAMPIIEFVLYCILSFVVLGFIVIVVLSWLPDVLPPPYNYELDFFIELLIVLSFIAFQCYRYVKIAKKSKKPNSVEDVDLGID